MAAIRVRQESRARERRHEVSWQTRILATYISAGYMGDGKSENTMLTSAATLSIDAYEAEALEYAAAQPAVGAAARENSAGSYERLAGLMAQRKG